MLRVTHDIWDEARYLDDCFEAWRKWSGQEAENFWIDMDMIPFGQLLMMSPKKEMVGEGDEDSIRLAGHGYRRWQQYSQDQMFNFITLRALSASPLMVGGDLPTMDGFSLRLLTDPDMLACNQNGVMGKLVSENDGIEVWHSPEKGAKQKGWVGIFNRTDRVKTFDLSPSNTNLKAGSEIYNIWKGRKAYKLDATTTHPIDINPDGVIFLRYE